jgi:hypothetical protein
MRRQDWPGPSLRALMCVCVCVLATDECLCAPGVCLPGYGCDAGSTDPRAQQCPAGKYSTTGICLDCPPGTYGQDEGMTTSACTGPCPAGRWGSGGSSTSECEGPIPGGYYCPAGFTLPLPPPGYKCPPGTYNAEGSSTPCTNCSSGFYGSTPGLTINKCSGECQVRPTPHVCARAHALCRHPCASTASNTNVSCGNNPCVSVWVGPPTCVSRDTHAPRDPSLQPRT